jgi:DNA-binding NarL/FixJ family response regulator
MPTLRILVADDHEVIRLGVRSMLEAVEGWTICWEAVDGREAVEKAKELKPDIVILDVGMPRLNGLDATRQILRDDPLLPIMILTVIDTEQMARAALEAGAKAYVPKTDCGRDLVAAVSELHYGRTFFTPFAAQIVLNGFLKGIRAAKEGLGSLTSREREIVQLLAEGQRSKEVATLLHLGVKTVETHRSNIMRKLNVHRISEVVLYAVRNDIVQVHGPGTELSVLG